MTVREWMTATPETIGSRDMLALAQEKMARGNFRRLPVVNDAGALIGMLTERDMRPHTGHFARTHVDAAMTEPVLTVTPDQSIESVAETLLQRKIGGLPVVDARGQLVGIITTSDLLRAFLASRRAP
jgi:acetoin utilization protein AcuB